MAERIGRVLIVAGSDSGGGAGIQADIKTVTALGGYAATAITAITVQNTLGVQAVHPLPADLVAAQMRAVLDDIGADVIKIGMLGDTAVIEAVAEVLEGAGAIPVVLDPVMIAKGGASLLEASAVETLKVRLLPQASLLTPNAPEACALTGLPVRSPEEMVRAGHALLRQGAGAVLMKGGHVDGDPVVDILITKGGERRFEHPRTPGRHTHGTGCTLSSACAAGLASGASLEEAVARAIDYTAEAIRRAPGFGAGHGPLDHGWPLRR